ncbi:MAG TPA: branched-chain amino acid ABC transporter permease [Actinospica sp.]|nr:branched-chain amino acid ABC transporter permease [Actinospica sp.]
MIWVNAVVQGVLVGGLYALFACGLSLMFGVMRIVNLAHGDFAVLAAFIAYSLISATGISLLWAAVLTVPVFAVFGYAVQRGMLNRAMNGGALPPLLATFGLSVLIQNSLLQGYTADSRALSPGSIGTQSVRVNGQISLSYLSLLILGLAVVVLGGLEFYLSRNRTGRMLRAASDDPQAASLVGGNPRHLYGIATALAFGTLALAGLLFAARSSVSPSSGPSELLFGFEAVVIGGLGSLWGTLLGGIALGIAQNVAGQADPADTLLAGHLLFLLVLILRPEGMLPRRRLA